MFRSCAPLLAAAALLAACGRQIVLGDSENALPAVSGNAGASSAGSSALGGSGGASAGSSSSGTAGAVTAGSPPLGALPEPGELVWSADHEVGSISQWERGGPYSG